MNGETKDYEAITAELEKLLDKHGAYIETQNTNEYGEGYKYIYIGIRVPAKEFKTLCDEIEELCHITSSSINADNVSERYHDAEGRLKSAQAKLDARIAELEYQVAHSVVIDVAGVDTSVIGVGSTVTILDVEFGDTMTYKIVGAPQASPDDGKISDKSPVGAALIGHKKGEKVTAQTPGGPADFEIIDVEFGR